MATANCFLAQLFIIVSLTSLARGAVSNQGDACASSADGPLESRGRALLQVKHETKAANVMETSSLLQSGSSSSPRAAPHRSNVFAVSRRSRAKVLADDESVASGSLATLSEEGYGLVSSTSCQLEMELFVRRLVDSFSFQICHEDGLLDLVSLHSAHGTSDFATLSRDIHEATPPALCAWVAPLAGSCPTKAKSPQCLFREKLPTSHRRRQCNALIQRDTVVDGVKDLVVDDCPLPAGAVWCRVRLDNLPAFWIAVYDWDVKEDWVSYNICQTGHWEHSDIAAFGPPGHMLDIGGNLGYTTFAFAEAGWTVTTFEPMLPNLHLMAATLCRNPHLVSRVNVNWFGLGTANQQCKMISPKNNVGDGFTRCTDKADVTPDQIDANLFEEKGTFAMRRLDEVLLEQGISKIDLIKIDVEGYEAQVFEGAPGLLAKYQPRLIKSEVWQSMVGSSGVDYLNRFKEAGYKFFKDSKCQIPEDA